MTRLIRWSAYALAGLFLLLLVRVFGSAIPLVALLLGGGWQLWSSRVSLSSSRRDLDGRGGGLG